MIKWIDPALCDPPHRITHPEKLEDLFHIFSKFGWDPEEPALIGYERCNRIQLISGTHRWNASFGTLLKIPVFLVDAVKIWGTQEWIELLINPPKAGNERLDVPVAQW